MTYLLLFIKTFLFIYFALQNANLQVATFLSVFNVSTVIAPKKTLSPFYSVNIRHTSTEFLRKLEITGTVYVRLQMSNHDTMSKSKSFRLL